MLIGAHESISGGVYKALERGESDDCDCVQIFTASPRMWQSKEFKKDEVSKWHELVEEHKIEPNVSHCSYLLNTASSDEKQRSKSVNALIEELKRCSDLKLLGAVIHAGSNKDAEERVNNIVKSFNEVIERTKKLDAKIIIENTAGEGNKAGASFEEISEIIKGVKSKDRVGVCVDTCHAFAAGYDLVNDYEKVWKEFKKYIGFNKLVCLHLNDSKSSLDSHKDRHAIMGKGLINKKGFSKLVNDERFKNIPGYLEQPEESGVYKQSINFLRRLIKT